MYVPPYDAILKAIGTDRTEIEKKRTVTIPTSFFKFLLKLAVAQGDFDEQSYLGKNPDVKDALGARRVEGAQWHYSGFGYFEARCGGTPAVDEPWYTQNYPDVAEAIRTGRVESATQHFEVIGATEWRAPQPKFVSDAQRWKAAIVKA